MHAIDGVANAMDKKDQEQNDALHANETCSDSTLAGEIHADL